MIDLELIDDAIPHCDLKLKRIKRKNGVITDADIDNTISEVTAMSDFQDIDKNLLKNQLLLKYAINIGQIEILEGRNRHKKWLQQYKASNPPCNFWKRYKEYLLQDKGYASIVIDSIDELTDKILDKLFDPNRRDIQIHKKGLVVGHVQSGKTANYTGLICKAADAGYKLIIVLAGLHNNLRSQTQTRLDEGFLGFDTQYLRTKGKNEIGVGAILSNSKATAHSITTSDEKGDFTMNSSQASGVNFDASDPILFVVKKNNTVLKNLKSWLGAYAVNGKIDSKSVLIIDDEADNASINTAKPNHKHSTINGHLIDILNLFNRVGYVGYTATPFANIFIPLNEKDLFPRDFIINIPAPSNYIGPVKVFGTSMNPQNEDELLPIVTTISDYENFVPKKHKLSDPTPSQADIPESLKTAIKAFILTCAIRIARGHEYKHNSMLIHVSRYMVWQNAIKELVEKQFRYYKNEIIAEDKRVLEEFRRMLEVDTPFYSSFHTITRQIQSSQYNEIDKRLIVHSWDEIRPLLSPAVNKIEVCSINGSSGDALRYYDNEDTGISVIAIGGDKLSRGLTLEGLSVSYFLRASKMYDTLMQMGRWFGYRPGYVDLCRLYTSSELNEWFRHVTIANEELRDEFSYLASAEATPDKFGLKVRSHPGVLQITSVAKMRYSNQMQVSWAGRLIETYQLPMDKGDLRRNYVATDNFLNRLSIPETGPNDNYPYLSPNYLWRNVSSEEVLSYFAEFKVSDNLTKFDMSRLSEFITKLNADGELNTWNVALMSNAEKTTMQHTIANCVVNCALRSRSEDVEDESTYFIRKNHIVGAQTDEFVDLDIKLIEESLKETQRRADKQNKEWTKKYPSPALVRNEYRSTNNPLLMIYVLDPEGANITKDKKIVKQLFTKQDTPIIGLAIAFPHTETNIAVSYVANQISTFSETEDEFDNTNDNITNE